MDNEFMLKESNKIDLENHYSFEFTIASSFQQSPFNFLQLSEFNGRKMDQKSLEMSIEDLDTKKTGEMDFRLSQIGLDSMRIVANITGYGTSWPKASGNVNYKIVLKAIKNPIQSYITELQTICLYSGPVVDGEPATGVTNLLTYKKDYQYELQTKNAPIEVNAGLMDSSKAMGGMLGGVGSLTGGGAEYASYLSLISTSDPSGLMLKFSQILKLMSRLRLVNISFGLYLESFLDSIGKIYDPGHD